MKRNIFFTAAFICIAFTLFAQKQMTKTGVIDIFSETSMFTIEATNKKTASILNLDNGELVASTLTLSFKFREALVEEHFNENYIESHKFPKATFKGSIVGYKKGDFSKDGVYKVKVAGKLEIHGETRDINENAEITVKAGKISAKCNMVVSLANYKIKIEPSYKDRIKDEIQLKMNFAYEPVAN